MEYTKGELCSCGFPQSHPIPHEHDRTEREKQIIEYKDKIISDLYEALKDTRKTFEALNYTENSYAMKVVDRALAKAEGK